jgi:hypothetical protein
MGPIPVSPSPSLSANLDVYLIRVKPSPHATSASALAGPGSWTARDSDRATASELLTILPAGRNSNGDSEAATSLYDADLVVDSGDIITAVAVALDLLGN